MPLQPSLVVRSKHRRDDTRSDQHKIKEQLSPFFRVWSPSDFALAIDSTATPPLATPLAQMTSVIQTIPQSIQTDADDPVLPVFVKTKNKSKLLSKIQLMSPTTLSEKKSSSKSRRVCKMLCVEPKRSNERKNTHYRSSMAPLGQPGAVWLDRLPYH
jgi:hypothetical protein